MKEDTWSDASNSNGCDFNSHHLSIDQLKPAKAEEEDYIRCSRCNQQVIGQMYHCASCYYYVHGNCIDLQQTIANHPLHPHATLTLSLVEFDTDCHCYGCPRVFKTSFLGYKCTECPRKLDLKCALSDLDISNIHAHALEFYYVNEQQQACNRKVHGDENMIVLIEQVKGKRCAVCELPVIGPVSGCEPCDFWIHKGCQYDFPPSVDNHRLHREDHPLTFLSPPPSLSRCGACGTPVLRNTFHCQECRFDLHPGCATREPSLLPQVIGNIHHHELTFFPDPAPFFRCYSCEGFCYNTPIYRCVECHFSLHKTCIEFPSTVNDKNHSCLLHHFEDFPFYMKLLCSACGEAMSPNPGAYCCSDCQYFVHLQCVCLDHEADHQEEKQTTVLGKVVRSEPLVDSNIEIDRLGRGNKILKDIEATSAQLCLEMNILKESELLHRLITK